jgi:quinol monooxygenase YgiN
MPGCLSYVIAKDSTDENTIWVTEVWESRTSHDASLLLPAVKAAIVKAKPIVAAIDNSVVTIPVGGHGLAQAKTP